MSPAQASITACGNPKAARLAISAVATGVPYSGNAARYVGPGIMTGQLYSPNRELSHAGCVGPDAVRTTRPSPLILFSSASTDSRGARARVNLKFLRAHSAREATIEHDEQPTARDARAPFAEDCQRD